MSLWFGMNFQNMTSQICFFLDLFHDFVLGVLIFILSTVMFLIWFLFSSKLLIKNFFESFNLEFLWTLYPIIILLFIGLPSMRILYLHEIEEEEHISLKISGHQWYWSVDYTNFKDLEFDMFMKPTQNLNFGELRLLETDNKIVLPLNLLTRLIISSEDVLHSWSMPNLGLKVDANPGRLNLIYFFPHQIGLYYGQCSEICGANHSFMPINLEVTNFFCFKNWIKNFSLLINMFSMFIL